MMASETSLVKFLANHPGLTQLKLKHIFLTSESWKPVIQHISREMRLKKLHLSDIASSGSRPSLIPDWDANPMQVMQRLSNGLPFIQARGFDGNSIKRGLDFLDMPERQVQTSIVQCMRELYVEYGSPLRHG